MKPGFLNRMERAFSARQHVILSLNTEDRFYFPEENLGPANLNYFLAAYFGARGFRVAQYAPSLGLQELDATGRTCRPVERGTGAVGALDRIGRLLRDLDQDWLVLMLHAERLAPSTPVGQGLESGSQAELLHTLALDDGIASGRSRMVLVTYSDVPDSLLLHCRSFCNITVDLPRESERAAFLDLLAAVKQADGTPLARLAPDLDATEAARTTAGMPLAGIEALCRSASQTAEGLTRNRIREAKVEAIQRMARDLLEVSEPTSGFDAVAGLNGIKGYLRRMIPGIRGGRPDMPQALLLQGVPGCGKSHLVQALAFELGWPLLEMRNIRNMYVGQSERNLEQVIRIVEQLQPALLFFDEIDQSLGQRSTNSSGDSGTSERMLARVFSWLGSLAHRGKLLFVGATNRPDLLDPALLDRFGVSLPFLKPGRQELCELVPLLLKRFERQTANLAPQTMADLLEPLQPTGRSVQEIILAAGLVADQRTDNVGSPISADDLKTAANNHIPRDDAEEMEYIGLLSLSMSGSQTVLPWNDEDGRPDRALIPIWLTERGVVGTDGRLDVNCLHERIDALRQRRHSHRLMR